MAVNSSHNVELVSLYNTQLTPKLLVRRGEVFYDWYQKFKVFMRVDHHIGSMLIRSNQAWLISI